MRLMVLLAAVVGFGCSLPAAAESWLISADKIYTAPDAPALEQGVVRWEDVHELGEVVAGRRPGRTGPDEVTLFESQGVAMEDVAVAVRVVARARERQVGLEIPI